MPDPAEASTSAGTEAPSLQTAEEAPSEPEEAAAPDEREGHPDDPDGWVPIDAYEGEPIVVHRQYHPEGELRSIGCYLPDQVGNPDGRHGPEWDYFKNGYKKEARFFRRGVAQGPFVRAWQSGQLRYQGEFVDGQRHGTYMQWWENGDLQMHFTYDHGVPTGRWREWYVDNFPRFEETYVDGKLHGERRTWDKPREEEDGTKVDGVLTLVENYRAGKRHGPWQDYDPTEGTPRVRGQYEDGVAVGDWEVRWRDGVVLDQYSYLEGQLHGPQRTFTPEGTPLELVTWDRGVKTGPASTFYGDGRVQAEGAYLEGLRHGPWRYYTPSGELNPAWSGVYDKDDKVGDLPDGS